METTLADVERLNKHVCDALSSRADYLRSLADALERMADLYEPGDDFDDIARRAQKLGYTEARDLDPDRYGEAKIDLDLVTHAISKCNQAHDEYEYDQAEEASLASAAL